jgi:hypothetical protein
MSHFIIRCKKCNTIISQCRCPSWHKPTTYKLCAKCGLGITQAEKEATNGTERD